MKLDEVINIYTDFQHAEEAIQFILNEVYNKTDYTKINLEDVEKKIKSILILFEVYENIDCFICSDAKAIAIDYKGKTDIGEGILDAYKHQLYLSTTLPTRDYFVERYKDQILGNVIYKEITNLVKYNSSMNITQFRIADENNIFERAAYIVSEVTSDNEEKFDIMINNNITNRKFRIGCNLSKSNYSNL